MKQFITVPQWLEIDAKKKQELLERFKIHKSGGVEVMNNKLICDGVSGDDLKQFNIGAMIDYLGKAWLPWYSPDLCDELLTLTLKKLYGGQPERNDVGSVGTSEGNSNSVVGIAEGNDNRTEEGTKPRGNRKGRKPTQGIS